MDLDRDDLAAGVRRAVRAFWRTRNRQVSAQKQRGGSDQGARASVTGGAQMDGFVELVEGLVRQAGAPEACVFRKRKLELPGYFRPTKEWDILVVTDGHLLAAIEAKSQVGPSFGNNFNNRCEEAIGSAVDLWTAYREGAFRDSPRPWLGYLFLLEDCERSRRPVTVKEPHFPVFDIFREASYQKRYELLCRHLVRERHYEAAALLISDQRSGAKGEYAEPAAELAFERFAASLVAHVAAYERIWGET